MTADRKSEALRVVKTVADSGRPKGDGIADRAIKYTAGPRLNHGPHLRESKVPVRRRSQAPEYWIARSRPGDDSCGVEAMCVRRLLASRPVEELKRVNR